MQPLFICQPNLGNNLIGQPVVEQHFQYWIATQMRRKIPRGVGVPVRRARLLGDTPDLRPGRGGQRGHTRGQPTTLPGEAHSQAWLPDGYSQIFILSLLGPKGLKDYGSTTLCCKF